MGIVRFNTLSLTRPILGHFGDGGVTEAVSAPQRNPTVCAVVSCVARQLLITVVCICVI